MEDLSQSNCEVNPFGRWQADYAAHGVATFPVDANKRPMVSRYSKFGLVGNSKIANKFADAPAIGFMCGRRNGITSLDCDSKDERVLADAMNRHGSTPLVARTGSGHFQAWIAITARAVGSGHTEMSRSIFWAPVLWWCPRHKAPRAAINLFLVALTISTAFRSCRTCRWRRGTIAGWWPRSSKGSATTSCSVCVSRPLGTAMTSRRSRQGRQEPFISYVPDGARRGFRAARHRGSENCAHRAASRIHQGCRRPHAERV